jgi:hypothetical protein
MESGPHEICKAHVIRRITGKTLTKKIVEAIGYSICSEEIARKQHAITIGGLRVDMQTASA